MSPNFYCICLYFYCLCHYRIYCLLWCLYSCRSLFIFDFFSKCCVCPRSIFLLFSSLYMSVVCCGFPINAVFSLFLLVFFLFRLCLPCFGWYLSLFLCLFCCVCVSLYLLCLSLFLLCLSQYLLCFSLYLLSMIIFHNFVVCFLLCGCDDPVT